VVESCGSGGRCTVFQLSRSRLGLGSGGSISSSASALDEVLCFLGVVSGDGTGGFGFGGCGPRRFAGGRRRSFIDLAGDVGVRRPGRLPLGVFGGGSDGQGWIPVFLPVDGSPGVVDGEEILLLRGGSVWGHRVRFVVSLFFAKGGMICASPWDVPPGPSATVAPALGSWAIGSEEDGVLGVLSFSLARMRLMCHSGARFVADCGSWRWIMQRFHVLELLDGEMDLPKLGGVGSRRRSVWKTAEKLLRAFVVIFVFMRVFFALWGCTVLQV